MLDNEWIAWEEGGIFASLFPGLPSLSKMIQPVLTLLYTVPKFETYIPKNETARPVSDSNRSLAG